MSKTEEVSVVKTVKEIKDLLQTIDEPTAYLEELSEDGRAGVKQALRQWHKRYAKKQQRLEAHQMKIMFDEAFQPFQGAMIAGVDEAGRGPLAGPVVTAAVILPQDSNALIGLDDSKAISKANRVRLATIIKDIALSYSVHIQSAELIDQLNIYQATKSSMEEAVKTLSKKPGFVIVDAMQLDIPYATKSIVKADEKSLAVAAASILAKTTRDELMEALHEEFPYYNFKNNAGYGTAEHLEGLQRYGPCKHHRTSFEPIKSMVSKGD